MKLYQKYKEIIKTIGKVEVAWFTSFNLDPDLVEKFLLSVLAGVEPEQLKTAEDYEAMNIELNKIDIKILYDYRALNLKNQKLTNVDFIAVNPEQTFKKNKAAIFHPKVIFIKGINGAFLITGSANLSISAWSSNKESVVIKKINNKHNAKEVLNFFEKVGVKNQQLTNWANRLNNKKTDWHFIHSLEHGFNLFQKIFDADIKQELTIWSPYFSKNIYELITRIKNYGANKISIVPNIDEAGKISINKNELQNLINDDSITIKYFDKKDIRQSLHHAKVWLTPEKLAIGSWNCSFVATGEKSGADTTNIEAGIIANIKNTNTENSLKSVLKSYTVANIPEGQTEEELEKQWKDVLNDFSINIALTANWDTFKYEIANTESINEGLYISLPHNVDKKIPIKNINGLSFKDGYIKVLKNKFYTVYDNTGKEVFRGYIQEINKEKRPVYTYVNLSDLFEALIKNPLTETHRKVCKYKLSAEDDENNDNKQQLEYKDTNSYYVMFVSFQRLYDEINSIKDNKNELDKIGFRLPGSLINIRSLIEESINELLKSNINKKDNDRFIYYFFIIQEVNRCIKLFNKYSETKVESLSKSYIKKLTEKAGFSKKDKLYINKLKKVYGYEPI